MEVSGAMTSGTLGQLLGMLERERERCGDVTELLKICPDYFLLFKQEKCDQGQISRCVERHTFLCGSWRVRVDTGI